MRRAALLAAGTLLLVVATVLAPRREAAGGPAAALGRSLGGLRVLLVDALFLRAEGLRRRGRVDEVPSLYRTVLELDPGNEAAFDYLAAVLALDVLPDVRDPRERAGWWAEAWDVVETGLRAHPRSARLLYRSADLLTLAARQPALAPVARARVADDPVLAALERLRDAVRAAPELPRAGYAHLYAAAIQAPQVAAERLAAGAPGVDRALAIGREVLALRPDLLARVQVLLGPDATGEEGADAPPLAVYLGRGVEAVAATAQALARGDRDAARAAVEAARREVPRAFWLAPLERAVRSR